jgi:hypothetical protein
MTHNQLARAPVPFAGFDDSTRHCLPSTMAGHPTPTPLEESSFFLAHHESLRSAENPTRCVRPFVVRYVKTRTPSAPCFMTTGQQQCKPLGGLLLASPFFDDARTPLLLLSLRRTCACAGGWA